MTDSQIALLVLVVLYLWECMLWLRRDAGGFLPTLAGTFRLKVGGGMYGTDRRALLLTHPFPHLGEAFICQHWPVSLSPEGVYAYVAQAFNPGNRTDQTERFIEWEKVVKIEFEADRLYLNGQLFVTTGTPPMARHLAGVLRQLKEAKADARAALIDGALRSFLDSSAVRTRFDHYRRLTRLLRLLCDLLFLHLLIVCPLITYRTGLLATWHVLLATLVLLMAAVTIVWKRVHAQLYPDERADRLTHLIPIMTFPPATARAGPLLSHHLLATFHPLAVARVLCDSGGFRELAAHVLRDLDTPIQPVCPDCPPQAARTEAFFRERLQTAIQMLIASAGLNLADLREPPVTDDPSSRTYCPRCHTEFLLDAGRCDACGGLPLRTLIASQSPSKTA